MVALFWDCEFVRTLRVCQDISSLSGLCEFVRTLRYRSVAPSWACGLERRLSAKDGPSNKTRVGDIEQLQSAVE